MANSATVLFNGVSTIDEPRFLIYIKDDKGIKTVGVSTSKKDAIEVIRNIGRSELKQIMKSFDEKWTKFTVEFDEENGPAYKISVQKLGYTFNSSPYVHTTVYFEETKLLYPSEYIEEKVEEKPAEQTVEQSAEQTPGQPTDGQQLVEQTVPAEPLITPAVTASVTDESK
jgi:hypothetical protein